MKGNKLEIDGPVYIVEVDEGGQVSVNHSSGNCDVEQAMCQLQTLVDWLKLVRGIDGG